MSNVTPITPGAPDERPIKPGDINDDLGKARAVTDLLLTVACSDDLAELDNRTMINALATILAHIDDAHERARALEA